jgi:hypothetical protein
MTDEVLWISVGEGLRYANDGSAAESEERGDIYVEPV